MNGLFDFGQTPGELRESGISRLPISASFVDPSMLRLLGKSPDQELAG
jgi:hypothetical protein